MKTGGGDFSPEAYEQLRDAYGKELQRQVDDEVRGTQLMGQEYGLETAPVDSPWADKIELWEDPDGKRDREDEKQSPNEILQIMRDAAQERIDALKEDEPEGVAESESEDEEADDQRAALRVPARPVWPPVGDARLLHLQPAPRVALLLGGDFGRAHV